MTQSQDSYSQEHAKIDIGPEPLSLTARVVKGTGWAFAGRMVILLLGASKVIVLARLLMPEDFGMFGIVGLVIATLRTISETGFSTALIQRKHDAQSLLDTAWTVQVIRGFLLALVLFCVASAVGSFFGEPRVAGMLRVACIVLVLEGCANIGTVYFRKNLEFNKQFVFDCVPAGCSLVVGVYFAYQSASVWAFIWAELAWALSHCVLSYVLHPYRPKPDLNVAKALELFRFGRWILGSRVVSFLTTHGDDGFVGKVLGASALGLYQVAFRVSNMVTTEVTFVVSRVALPAYSTIQDDTARLRSAYLRVMHNIFLAVVPFATFFAFFAPEIVRFTIGPKWEAASILITILAAEALVRSIVETGSAIYSAAGRPNYSFWTDVVTLSILVISIVPLGYYYGLVGVCLSTLLSHAGVLPLWFFFTKRIIRLDIGDYAHGFLQSVVAAGLFILPPCAVVLLIGRSIVPLVAAAILGGFSSLSYVLYQRWDEWKRVARSFFS